VHVGWQMILQDPTLSSFESLSRSVIANHMMIPWLNFWEPLYYAVSIATAPFYTHTPTIQKGSSLSSSHQHLLSTGFWTVATVKAVK
jgi:hypothetical protein